MWQIKIGRDISTAEVLPKGARVSAPHQDPQPRVSVPGKEVSITSGCKNQWGLWLIEMEGLWDPRQFLLKGLHTDLLRLPPSKLQHWGSNLKATRDRKGRTEVSSIRVRVEGVAFSLITVLAKAIVALMSPPHHRAARWAPYVRFHQPCSHDLFHSGDSLRPHPTQL